MPLSGRWLRWSPRFLRSSCFWCAFPGLHLEGGVAVVATLTGLPVDHGAGEGAGDAVHGLDAGGYQPAQLIQTGRLDLGDAVVRAGEVLGLLHTVKIIERLGDMG